MLRKIAFLTTLHTNVGDDFIRCGIRHVLDLTGVAYAPLFINKHDERSLGLPAEDEPLLSEHKYRECDLIVQSGAPVYWNLPPHSSVTSEWHEWFWERLVLSSDGPAKPILLNLGAGSCQPLGQNADAYLANPACADFARRAGQRASLTTVRDPLASEILQRLAVPHHALPCPAFFAAARLSPRPALSGIFGLNLMPLAGHWDLSGNFDTGAWAANISALLGWIRSRGQPLFVCHDPTEVEFCRRFAAPGERIFHSSSWREYMDVYSQCSAIVANRVHGAVCGAGFGVPAVIIGNDSRTTIADYIGLSRYHPNALNIDELIAELEVTERSRADKSQRLTELRDRSIAEYVQLIAPLLHGAATT